MISRAAATLALLLVLTGASAPSADEKGEWKDVNGNGKNDTREVYRGKALVRVELDKNEDGAADKIIQVKGGIRRTAEADTNYDGKIDTWIVYNSKGTMALRAQDRDKDGKPEYFNKMLKGTKLILREWDTNNDGKIDKRTLVQWGEKRYAPGMAKVPGYFPITREEDTDFDGKVDKYYKKGDKTAKSRIGQPMDPEPDRVPYEEPKPQAAEGSGGGGASGNLVQRLVDRMNERFGYGDDPKKDKKKVVEV